MEDGGMMMSSRAISQVLKYSRASKADKFILTVIAHHFNEAVGQAWPSTSMLAKETGYDRRRVKRSLANLRRLGEIRSDENNGGRNRSNRYYITLPIDAPNGGTEDTVRDSLNGGTGATLLNLNGGTGATANGGTGATRIEHLIESKERETTESPIPDSPFTSGERQNGVGKQLPKFPTSRKRSSAATPRSDRGPIVASAMQRLNEKAGRTYKLKSKVATKHIGARLNEGFTEPDFLRVVDYKCAEWKGDPKMERYLRPETLFSLEHFESYLQEAKVSGGMTDEERKRRRKEMFVNG